MHHLRCGLTETQFIAQTSNIIHTFILFIRQRPHPATAGSTHTNAKEREKKERQVRGTKKIGNEGQRTKPPTSTQEIDALIGDEEQNMKQKKEEK